MPTQTTEASPRHKFRDAFDSLHFEITDISALIGGTGALLEAPITTDHNTPAGEGPKSLLRMAEEKLEALETDIHTLWEMYLALDPKAAAGSSGLSEVMENYLIYNRKKLEIGAGNPSDLELEEMTDELAEIEKLVFASPTKSSRDLAAKFLVAIGGGDFGCGDEVARPFLTEVKSLVE